MSVATAVLDDRTDRVVPRRWQSNTDAVLVCEASKLLTADSLYNHVWSPGVDGVSPVAGQDYDDLDRRAASSTATVGMLISSSRSGADVADVLSRCAADPQPAASTIAPTAKCQERLIGETPEPTSRPVHGYRQAPPAAEALQPSVLEDGHRPTAKPAH